MRWVSSVSGVLRALDSCPDRLDERDALTTGLAALDNLLPHQRWRRGAIHEMLGEHDTPVLPLLLAKRAALHGAVVWSDPAGELYLPAIVGMGLNLDRLILLQPRTPHDELWALNECLRCKGVAACVARISKLSILDARRLQLAAEGGGGIGLLLRPSSAIQQPYAATTRWRVRSEPGERSMHRWKVQMIHGHGGRIGESVILEVSRDTNLVCAFEAVADRSTAPATTALTA